jgi:hypothetical protein
MASIQVIHLFEKYYNGVMDNKRSKTVIIIVRILIGIVTILNLQAAAYFMIRPADYAPGFELNGEAGEAMVRGVGLLFLMWNIPYLMALINPLHHFVSLIEAVIMQGIGVLGESIILLTLKGEHSQIHASVSRFIVFDGGGFLVLLLGLILFIPVKRILKKESI